MDKGFWDGDVHTGEELMKDKKFLYIQKLLHKQGRGQLLKLRGECINRYLESNMERTHLRDH